MRYKLGDEQVSVIVGTEKVLGKCSLQQMSFGNFVQKFCGHYRGQARSDVAYVKNLPYGFTC